MTLSAKELAQAVERLAIKLIGYDDEIIGAALADIAVNYPATFASIKRELATAESAAAYYYASRGA